MKSKSHTIEALKEISVNHPIIAFDGVCNMCNGYVQWMIKRDKHSIFRYATLQSETGLAIKSALDAHLDSVVLIHNNKLYTQSDVALQAMNILGGKWTVFSYLLFLPKGFRDMIYRWVARNRYQWFGKREACMIPTREIKAMFL